MWTATIESIYDTPVPSGKKVINVRFSDGAAREIRRAYHLGADQIDTAQEAADFLQSEVAKLDKADEIATDLEAILGQQITATSAPGQFGVPKIISDRQFFHALAKMGIISNQEALGAVKTGTIPQAMLDIVNQVANDNDRFDVEMVLSGAIEFQRTHPLVATFAAAMGWTDAQVDDLYLLARTL